MKKLFSKKEGSKGWNTSAILQNLFKSVGMKLFVTFFVSIIAFVSVLGFFSYQTSKNAIKDRVSEISYETITKASQKMDQIFTIYDIFIGHAESSNSSILSNYLEEPDGTIRKEQYFSNLNDRIRQFLNADKNLHSIHYFDVNGDPIIYGGTSFPEDNQIAELDWYKKTIEKDGEVYWIESQAEGFTKRSTIGLGKVVKDPDSSSNIAVLLVEININNLSNILDQIVMGDNDEKMVIDEQGSVIYSTVSGQVGESSALRDESNKGSNDSGQFIGTNTNGNEQLVVFDKSEYTNWFVVGTVPVSEVVKGTDTIFNFTIIMVLLAAVVAVIIGYLLARTFGRPLVNLRNLMKKGEQGDLSVRTNLRSKDEIGQLGESFNQMMEQITALVQQTNQSAQEVLNTASNLSDVSKKTATASREISVATEQIAEGASSLAVEAERGNELTQNIKEEMSSVVNSNIEMGKSANDVRKVSEQGIEYMSELINKTNMTEQMTRSMSEKVDHLKESTSSIRKILDVLNNVSQQTNILSLNATIEAARAGEAGKGFMVVADEIRMLAEQSRESIDVVRKITDGIQNEVEDTVNTLSEAYPIFKEQTDSVREADLIFKNVQEQMGDFIQHLDTVTNSIQQLENSQNTLSEAMSNVSSVSEESSATSEEVASLTAEQLSVSDGLVQLSEKLETLSHTLKDSLSKFNT